MPNRILNLAAFLLLAVTCQAQWDANSNGVPYYKPPASLAGGGGVVYPSVLAGGSNQPNRIVATTNFGGNLWFSNTARIDFGGIAAAPDGDIFYNAAHTGDSEFQFGSAGSFAFTPGYGGGQKSVVQFGSGNRSHEVFYINSDGSLLTNADATIPDWPTNSNFLIAPSKLFAWYALTNDGTGGQMVGSRAEWNTNMAAAELDFYNPVTWKNRQQQTTYWPGTRQLAITTNGVTFDYRLAAKGGLSTPYAGVYGVTSNDFRGVSHFVDDGSGVVVSRVKLVNIGTGVGTGSAIESWTYNYPGQINATLAGKITLKYADPASNAGEIDLAPQPTTGVNNPVNALVICGSNNAVIVTGTLAIQAAARPVATPSTGILQWNSNNARIYFIGTNNAILGSVP